MGQVKHITKIREFLKRTPVVHIQSIRNIIGNSAYADLLLHQMRKKKEVYRITKGWYSLSDDPTLAVFCFKPSYLGLQDALSIHGLWEQESNPVIMTTRIVREGVRTINGSNVILKRIPPALFFGIEQRKYGSYYVPVSDIEKTFLDMIHFRQPIDRETLRLFKKRMDRKKLDRYGKRYPLDVRKKVMKMMERF